MRARLERVASRIAPPIEEETSPMTIDRFAFSNGNLLLEAPDQTWRIVDVDGKPPEYPKVKSLIRWQ
jgi:hypothetical protein